MEAVRDSLSNQITVIGSGEIIFSIEKLLAVMTKHKCYANRWLYDHYIIQNDLSRGVHASEMSFGDRWASKTSQNY